MDFCPTNTLYSLHFPVFLHIYRKKAKFIKKGKIVSASEFTFKEAKLNKHKTIFTKFLE